MTDDLNASSELSASDPELASREVRDWLEAVSGPRWLWYIKRLAANDTLATGAHQAGFYVPKEVVRKAFPVVSTKAGTDENPDSRFALSIDSHAERREARLVWYNNRIVSEHGTRNEARITNLGGGASPLLDPDATGSLVVFAFELDRGENCSSCRSWICRNLVEEIAVEDLLGPIEPGRGLVHSPSMPGDDFLDASPDDCNLTPDQFPAAWRGGFPAGEELVAKAVERLVELRSGSVAADIRLLKRRDCEFALFRALEAFHILPVVKAGFDNVDAFVSFANAATNRRKSRSGRSLELQAEAIFREEHLPHSRGQTTEGNKRPDFLFPSAEAYHSSRFPAERLRTLAAKTTCKDRWRQILNEADRIPNRFLLTLQEGVSVNQWQEMDAHRVVLVVPSQLHEKFPKAVRPHLWPLDRFIRETMALVTA